MRYTDGVSMITYYMIIAVPKKFIQRMLCGASINGSVFHHQFYNYYLKQLIHNSLQIFHMLYLALCIQLYVNKIIILFTTLVYL
jgi:hypothetical protein